MANSPAVTGVTRADQQSAPVPHERYLAAHPAASAPSAVCHFNDTIIVVFRGPDHHLWEYWRDGAAEGLGDLTAAANAPAAAGDPFAYIDPVGDRMIVLFSAADHGVHSISGRPGGPTRHTNLTAATGERGAGFRPVGWFSTHDQYHHIAYRGFFGGGLFECWWKEHGDSGRSSLLQLSGAPNPDGDLCAYYDTPRSTNIVTFRTVDGHIRSVYWVNDVGTDDLSGVAGTAPAAGDPFAWYSPIDDTHHIVYCTTDGHIVELYSRGQERVQGRTLTALAGAPRAAGSVTGGDNAPNNARNIFYRAADGSLHQLSYVIGQASVAYTNLTTTRGALPAADGRLAYFVTQRAPRQHLVYRGVNNRLCEVQW